MRVAVVTAYYQEPLEVLERCHASVGAQTHPQVEHVLVADGFPRPEADAWGPHIRLPMAHRDFGDTPRVIGAVSAATRGVDAITFLDADNWYEPEHIATLVRLQQETGADVVSATRNLRRPDLSLLGVCTESDGEAFADTNCMFLTRRAFGALGAVAFKDPRGSIVGDRILWDTIRNSQARRAHSAVATVNYVAMAAFAYLQRGEPPPPGARCIVSEPGAPFPRQVSYEEFQRLAQAGQG